MIFVLFLSRALSDQGDIDIITQFIAEKQTMKAFKYCSSHIKKVGLMDADPLLFYYRGITAYDLMKYPMSLEDLSRFIRVTSEGKELNHAHLIRGKANLKLGNLDDARRDANVVHNDDLLQQISDVQKIIDVADQKHDEAEYRVALDIYHQALKVCTHSTNLLIKGATCALELGDDEQYTDLSARALEINPDNSQLLLLRGRQFLCEEDFDMAVRHFKRCAQIDSSSKNKCPMYLRNTNDFKKNLDKFETAVNTSNVKDAGFFSEKMEKIAAKFCKNNSQLYIHTQSYHAEVMGLNGSQKAAVKYLDDLLAQNPNQTYLLLTRGHILYDLGDPESSNRDFQLVKKLNPKNEDATEMITKIAKERDAERNVDFYELLGLQRGCSMRQIKDAYRKAARDNHPDRISDPIKKKEAERRMKNINRAWDTLSDPEKKRMYDLGIDPETGVSPDMQTVQGPDGKTYAFPKGFDVNAFMEQLKKQQQEEKAASKNQKANQQFNFRFD